MMGKEYEKPHYINVKREDKKDTQQKTKTMEQIKAMLKSEAFGVLATNAQHESYTSLISFAATEDSTFLAFSTPIQTRKYEMIEKDENVSILIDNRAQNQNTDDINQIAAITALGTARIVKEKVEIKEWSKLLVDKHSYLEEFIYAETSAIILVDVSKYYYVSSFQEVIEWEPE